jgi:signal transduction histidine kinase
MYRSEGAGMKGLLRRIAIGASSSVAAAALTAFIWAGFDWQVWVRVFNTALLWYVNIALLIPAVAWLVSRTSLDELPRPVFFVVHLSAALVFAGLWTGMAFLDLRIYADPAIEEYLRGMSIQYFNIGIFVYAAAAGWLYTLKYQTKARQQMVREAELVRLAREAELRALKAQINPHFLFNTLNTVNALASEDPEGARAINARLAGVIRYALNGSENDFVTLQQELEFIEDYLGIEKARLGNRLRYALRAAPELREAKIPPMTLQPIVENAVKHGIAERPNGGTVELSVELRGGALQLRVHDTGPGVGSGAQESLLGRGLGLRNVVKRLEGLYESEFSFSIEGDSTSGCTVQISFPLERRDP